MSSHLNGHLVAFEAFVQEKQIKYVCDAMLGVGLDVSIEQISEFYDSPLHCSSKVEKMVLGGRICQMIRYNFFKNLYDILV